MLRSQGVGGGTLAPRHPLSLWNDWPAGRGGSQAARIHSILGNDLIYVTSRAALIAIILCDHSHFTQRIRNATLPLIQRMPPNPASFGPSVAYYSQGAAEACLDSI